MPTRTARTAWDGSLEMGSGQVELTSSGLGPFEVSFPQRTSDDGGCVTNPEELIGASHSACYAMQLSAVLGEAGGTVHSLAVQADVSLGADPDGGFKLTGISLTVRGKVDGVDDAGFVEAAQAAKTGCPISKALGGVNITLDAALEAS